MSYFLEIRAPDSLSREQRDLTVQFLLQVAKRFRFLGLQEWEFLLGAKEKVLGIADEFHDLTKGRSLKNQFTIFFATKKDAVNFQRLLDSLVEGLSFGKIEKQKKQDWMRAWRSHFKPFSLAGRALWIYPAWIKIPRARKKKLFVRIHPGQAFGTGTHATTSLCLEHFLKNAKSLRKGSLRLLDFGAGTGILAIAAEKWARSEKRKIHSVAVEIDPVARAQTRINAKLNGVKLQIGKVVNAKQKFDVIFANVLAPVLLERRELLLSSLAPGGQLYLSGILWKESRSFQRNFHFPKNYRVKRIRSGDWALFLAKQSKL